MYPVICITISRAVSSPHNPRGFIAALGRVVFVDGREGFQGAKTSDIGLGDIWEGGWCGFKLSVGSGPWSKPS